MTTTPSRGVYSTKHRGKASSPQRTMASYAWLGAGLGAFVATRAAEDVTVRAAFRARLVQGMPSLGRVYAIVPECALDIFEVTVCALLGSVAVTLAFTALSGVVPAVAVAGAYACIRSGHADRLRDMARDLLRLTPLAAEPAARAIPAEQAPPASIARD
jgi:hypothetical protein